MTGPELFDIVELLVDIPEKNLRAGAQGTVVNRHTEDVFEVEFANEEGETLALCALPLRQFIVVWQAKTGQWVTTADQVAQIVSRLPDEASTEVLDFARFLKTRIDQIASE